MIRAGFVLEGGGDEHAIDGSATTSSVLQNPFGLKEVGERLLLLLLENEVNADCIELFDFGFKFI